MKSRNRIGLAVFGAGRIGRIHAGNVHASPLGKILHVADVSPTAARDLAATCDARLSTVDEALADERVGAVIIASSTDSHASLIEDSAQAGKAIFCEKPLDLDVATARRSLAIVADHQVALYLGFNRRHDPSFSQLKTEIAGGAVGALEMLSITSRDPSPPPADYISRSGGLFRDMMIHDFDMARWLLDEEPLEVFAWGSVLVDEKIGEAGDVDTAVAVLKTASGRLCHISNSRRCDYGYDQRIEAFGSKGMVCAGNATATHLQWADKSGYHSEVALPFFLERYADAYRLQLEKFLRAVSGETVEIPGGEDGLRALEIADAAQKSLETGVPVLLRH
jgi:myo-inositol 2-dehydrogenase/D-chiro-inositol 1-dehydrogenase